jgi:hypothetical protein
VGVGRIKDEINVYTIMDLLVIWTVVKWFTFHESIFTEPSVPLWRVETILSSSWYLTWRITSTCNLI